jgi:hypothetical protein
MPTVGRSGASERRAARKWKGDPAGPGDEADLGDLLTHVARGDQTAFERVYDEVSGPVYGLALRIVRDPAQSEEVAQEVLVEVWRTASRYEAGRGSAMSWVMMLAHRRAVDRVRSAQAAAEREQRVGRADGPVYVAARDAARTRARPGRAYPPGAAARRPPGLGPRPPDRLDAVCRLSRPGCRAGRRHSARRAYEGPRRRAEPRHRRGDGPPDARTVTGKVRPGGSGTVVASRSLGKAVIVMRGLPELSSARTYELWLMGPRPPRPAGTVRPPAKGDPGPVLATGLGDATQIGITVEPAAGSQRPTTPPIFTATLF